LKKTILIIEDEKEFASALSDLLKVEGYDVVIALNGMEGLEKIKTNLVHLIILDVMMPRIDGYKVCRMLKFDKKYSNIPILMLTAKAQEQDKITAEQCGADAYLLKSQRPEFLLAKVKEMV
jgi:two-component system alkaline phosphatase synthesis response regulator PhoP/two-component system response regulator VicR